MHCGSYTGLCSDSQSYLIKRKYKAESKTLWDFFSAVIKGKQYDAVFCLGDCIDGTGRRSGGVEQITTDEKEQADIAVEIFKAIDYQQAFLVAGTPYHSGECTDWEEYIAEQIPNADFSCSAFVDVNGVVFSLKHKIGSSGIPHGRHTAAAKARMWNMLNDDPDADVFLRGHVHYYNYCGGPDWLAMTCPALQGSTRYGSRQCEGVVNFGCVEFFVDDDGGYSWVPHVVRVANSAQELRHL